MRKQLVVAIGLLALFTILTSPALGAPDPSLDISETELEISDTTSYTSNASDVYSLNEDIAIVNNGEIEAIGVGTTTIRATEGTDFVEKEITVNEPAAEDIKINLPKYELFTQESVPINVTVEYTNGYERDITDESNITTSPGLTYNQFDNTITAGDSISPPFVVSPYYIIATWQGFFEEVEFEITDVFSNNTTKEIEVPSGINNQSVYIVGNGTNIPSYLDIDITSFTPLEISIDYTGPEWIDSMNYIPYGDIFPEQYRYHNVDVFGDTGEIDNFENENVGTEPDNWDLTPEDSGIGPNDETEIRDEEGRRTLYHSGIHPDENHQTQIEWEGPEISFDENFTISGEYKAVHNPTYGDKGSYQVGIFGDEQNITQEFIDNGTFIGVALSSNSKDSAIRENIDEGSWMNYTIKGYGNGTFTAFNYVAGANPVKTTIHNADMSGSGYFGINLGVVDEFDSELWLDSVEYDIDGTEGNYFAIDGNETTEPDNTFRNEFSTENWDTSQNVELEETVGRDYIQWDGSGSGGYAEFTQELSPNTNYVQFYWNDHRDLTDIFPDVTFNLNPLENGTILNTTGLNEVFYRLDFDSIQESLDWIEFREYEHNPLEYGYVETDWKIPQDEYDENADIIGFNFSHLDNENVYTDENVTYQYQNPMTDVWTEFNPENTTIFSEGVSVESGGNISITPREPYISEITTRVILNDTDVEVPVQNNMSMQYTYQKRTNMPQLHIDGNETDIEAVYNGRLNDSEHYEIDLPDSLIAGNYTITGFIENDTQFDFKFNGTTSDDTAFSNITRIHINADTIDYMRLNTPETMFPNSTSDFSAEFVYDSGRTEEISISELENLQSSDTDILTINGTSLQSYGEFGNSTISAEIVLNGTLYANSSQTEVIEPGTDTAEGWIWNNLDFGALVVIISAITGIVVSVSVGTDFVAHGLGWLTTIMILLFASFFGIVSLFIPALTLMIAAGVLLLEVDGL